MSEKDFNDAKITMRHITLIDHDEFMALSKPIFEQMLRNQFEVIVNARLISTETEVNRQLVYWCKENCKSLIYHHESVFYFEADDEAAAFKLRWMS